MAIIVRGATCSLGEAVVDKLLSMDIDVVAIEESHRIRNETLLKYSEAKLLSEGEGYSISFDGSVADLVIGENLIVHDLIPTRNDKWMPDEFKSWSIGKAYKGKPRYWLSVIDAANAIAHLANSGNHYSGLHMCGRREWLCEDTRAEFEMLWERTSQGQSGSLQLRLCLDMKLQAWKLNQYKQTLALGLIYSLCMKHYWKLQAMDTGR